MLRVNWFAGDTMALARPFAEVDQLAALGTKRSPHAGLCPWNDLIAGRAVDLPGVLTHDYYAPYSVIPPSAAIAVYFWCNARTASCNSGSPASLTMTSSATARRCSRLICWFMIAFTAVSDV